MHLKNVFLLGALSTLGGAALALAPPGPDGYWQAEGYGRVLHIENAQARFFDVSAAGCVSSFEEPLSELGEIVHVDATSMLIEYGINRYPYSRLATLPPECATALESIHDPNDALANFDALWHTFDENYAFFDDRNVDWQAVREQYRSRLTPDSNPVELYQTLTALLNELDDGHVDLEAPDDVVDQASQITDTQANPSMFSLQRRAQERVVDAHVPEVQEYHKGIVRWGWIDSEHNARVGYIQINAMLLLANYALAEDVDFPTYFGQYFAHASQREYQYRDEVDGARQLMARIMESLRQADAIILDLRFNVGGKDGAGLAMLAHFLPRQMPIFTKQVRTGEGFSQAREITLAPADPTFYGPVYLLTGVGTASAAEVMVLGSMALKNVTRVGSPTEGIFSDSLDKKLPNGWDYTLSNERYQDLKGSNYEAVGIPPHYSLNYPNDPRSYYESIIDGASDGDEAIEWVLEQASRR